MQPDRAELITWATGAGAIVRQYFGRRLDVKEKGYADLVTEADYRSEAYLIDCIRRVFPEHTIVTEESGHLQGEGDHRWYIDPLDGTLNYAHGMPFFAVSLAYAYGEQVQLGVIYDPIRQECFSAERGKGAWLNEEPICVSQVAELIDSLLVTGFPGDVHTSEDNNLDHYGRLTRLCQGVRRLGSAALDAAYVASGRLDGFWELRVGAWDIAAGGLIVEEAGGVVTSFEGRRQYMSPPYSLVAANPLLHPKLLAALHED